MSCAYVDCLSDDLSFDEEASYLSHYRQQDVQIYDCALPSSVYQRCYPISLSRKASLCSIGTIDSIDYLSSCSGSIYSPKSNHNNSLQSAEFEVRDSGSPDHDEIYFSNQKNQKTREENYSGRHGDNDPDDRRHLEDVLVSCCYEEECAFGLYDLLKDKLESQIKPLLCSYFGRTSAVFGIKAILASAVPDILRLSEEEPYGIRGASIILKFRNDGPKRDCPLKPETLGIIALDHATVSTFELILVLSEERRLGVTLKNWFKAALNKSAPKVHIISPNYEIKKKILYR